MAGRLTFFLPRWKEITKDPVVLEAVSEYRLPFHCHPPRQIIEPTVHMSKREQEICNNEITRLCAKGAIEIVTDSKSQFLSSFFVIRKPSGGWRFILYLKRLNEYIFTPHFKLEDLKTAIRLLSPGDFLASIDLEDAYLLIPIHLDDRRFLRFRFQNQLFQFTALPFGLASAPYIFTKILRPVMHFLRKKGFLSVVYLDDFLLIAKSYTECADNVSMTIRLLSALGFVVNMNKSILVPTTSCRFLGFLYDTKSFSISIPPDKRDKLGQIIITLLSKRSCKIRLFASLIGSLISVCPAVKYGILHTKLMEREKFLTLLSTDNDFECQMSILQLEKIYCGGNRSLRISYNETVFIQGVLSS